MHCDMYIRCWATNVIQAIRQLQAAAGKEQLSNNAFCAGRADSCALNIGTVFSVRSVPRCYKQDTY
jgi:hypothetical protein